MNEIGIVGKIKNDLRLAAIGEEQIYETKILAERKSGTVDELFLQIPESAMGNRIEQYVPGREVIVYGKVRTRDAIKNVEGMPHTKVFILATIVQINTEKPAEEQNEVHLSGMVGKRPYYKRLKEKNISMAGTVLVINEPGKQTAFIPILVFGEAADRLMEKTVGQKMELWGRMQSREYIKRRDGEPDIRMTTHEVATSKII